MTSKLSKILWSAGGLLVTLLIAWYFSRNNNSEVTAPSDSNVPPNISFGGTTIAPVTVTGGSGSGSGACCTRCSDSTSQSGGKILQSGDFTQATFAATHAAASTGGGLTSNAATAGTPTGVQLIAQQNGGMPLPADSWWANDPLYRQAYVIAYNQTVGQLAQLLMGQKRPAISALPMGFANSANPGPVDNQVAADGQKQLARGGHDQRWLTEAQANSMLMLNTMQQTLNQWLTKLGDKNVAGNSLALPPDQNVSQFLIN